MELIQVSLFIGPYYRCHACGQDVVRVHPFRRFRFCDACWTQYLAPIRPDYTGPLDEALSLRRDAFIGWYRQLEQRYPTGRIPRYAHITHRHQDNGGEYWPFCAECGTETKEFDDFLGIESLFGRLRHKYCPHCEARHTVESIWRMRETLVPGRDDEDWLDLFAKSHPEAFALGILPDYWFKLKQQECSL